MQKADHPPKKEALKEPDFLKDLTFEEEIYNYSVVEYNKLLDARPWSKE